MLKNEFIEMQRQDLVTSNDENLQAMFECFVEVLSKYPGDTEIDPSKTVTDCYNQMEEEARRLAKNNKYCFTPTKAMEFVEKYLNLQSQEKELFKLEDFI